MSAALTVAFGSARAINTIDINDKNKVLISRLPFLFVTGARPFVVIAGLSQASGQTIVGTRAVKNDVSK